MNAVRVYVAGPLFTAAERSWNDHLAWALRREGFCPVLPQDPVPPPPPWRLWWGDPYAARKGGEARAEAVFRRNIWYLQQADLVLANLDGPDVDSGTAFEVGFAYAQGIPVYGYLTDFRHPRHRAGEFEFGLNLMLTRAVVEMLSVQGMGLGMDAADAVANALRASVNAREAMPAAPTPPPPGDGGHSAAG